LKFGKKTLRAAEGAPGQGRGFRAEEGIEKARNPKNKFGLEGRLKVLGKPLRLTEKLIEGCPRQEGKEVSH